MDLIKIPTTTQAIGSELASEDIILFRDVSENENSGGIKGISITELAVKIATLLTLPTIPQAAVTAAASSYSLTHNDWTVDYSEVEAELTNHSTAINNIITKLELAGILTAN